MPPRSALPCTALYGELYLYEYKIVVDVKCRRAHHDRVRRPVEALPRRVHLQQPVRVLVQTRVKRLDKIPVQTDFSQSRE